MEYRWRATYAHRQENSSIMYSLQFADRQFIKWVLGLTFAATLVTANFTASKLTTFPIPAIGPVEGSVAVFAIGISFLCTDLLSEIYGKREARQVVNGTIFALIIAYLLAYVAVALPPADIYNHNQAFQTIFNSSLPFIIASIVSILISQNIDVSIFHWIRSITGGEYKWVRNIGSTSVSQLLDTSTFTILGFMLFPLVLGNAPVSVSTATGIIMAEYSIKVIIAFFDTPIFYLGAMIFTDQTNLQEITVGD